MKQTSFRINIVYPFFLLFSVFFLLCFFSALYLGKTVYGDGLYYYTWLRSLAIDHDVSFFNEYQTLGITQLPTRTGLIGNIYSIGPALLWAPGFLTIHTLFKGSGYEFPYQLSVALLSMGYAIAGSILLYRVLSRHFSPVVSILTALGIATGTNMLYYGAIDTVNSHAVSFFVSTVLLNLVQEVPLSAWKIGGFIGLLALIRIQDSIFLLLPGSMFLMDLWQKVQHQSPEQQFKMFLKTTLSVIVLLVSFVSVFSVQIAAWYSVYGSYYIPYLNRGYGFDFRNLNIVSVLFSPHNGLLLWTPLVFVAVVGLLLGKQKRIFTNIIFLVFLVQAYIIASWSTWWQGASFSGRMFISLLPFLAFGLANVLTIFERKHWTTKQLTLLILPFTMLTIGLIFYFLHIT